jgi:hypothetical protein
MKPILLPFLVVVLATVSGLTSCAEVSRARTESLKNRIERQDERIQGRNTRRAMRMEAEDRRYHDWYDRIMGRPNPGF